MPEDLEPRSAPSDSLVGLLAIAESLGSLPALPTSEVSPASEVCSLVDHYIAGGPSALTPEVSSTPEVPASSATLTAASVDAVVQTETTVGRDAVLPNFDPNDALRQQADAMVDQLANQLPAALAAFPFDNPPEAPTGGGSAGIGAGCALLAAAASSTSGTTTVPLAPTPPTDAGSAPNTPQTSEVPFSSELSSPAGLSPSGGIPAAPTSEVSKTPEVSASSTLPAPAPHGEIQPLQVGLAPPATIDWPAALATGKPGVYYRSLAVANAARARQTPVGGSSGQMLLLTDSGGSGGNHPPVANPDQYTMDPGQGSLYVAAPGVLGNDTDEDGDWPLHAILDSSPDCGTLDLHDDGSFTFTPPSVWSGVNFTYYANDGQVNSLQPATVTINGGASPTPRVSIDADCNNDGVVSTDDLPFKGSLPGVVIGLDDNDSNANLIPDLEEAPLGPYDDMSLVILNCDTHDTGWTIVVDQALSADKLRLSATAFGPPVPADPNTPLSFPADQCPVFLFAQGYHTGSGTLGCELVDPSGAVVAGDGFVFTVANADADNDADNTGVIEGTAYEDRQELVPPGQVIRVNNDDDNGNGVEDSADPGPLVDPITGQPVLDDDLAPINLSLDTGGVDLSGFTIQLRCWDSLGEYDLYATQSKDPLPSSFPVDDFPSQFYTQGFAPGEYYVSATLLSPCGLELHADTDKFDADIAPVVNLGIADGQSGQYVPEELEDTRGAFTVANMNDTDADGIADNLDDDVTATPNGQNEKDLMWMYIAKPSFETGGSLTLDIGYTLKLWESPFKRTQFPADSYGEVHFQTSQLPKTVYVEVPEPMTAFVTASYTKPGTSLTDTDEVKVTGVWATVTAFEHDTRNAAAIWQDPTWQDLQPTDDPRIQTQFNGGTGLRTIDVDYGVCNGMLMQFTVWPADIASVPDVRFDITRRMEEQDQEYWDHEPVQWTSLTLPPKADWANDDDLPEADETLTPNANGHMYVADGPGPGWAVPPFTDEEVERFNAWEYMRVSIEPASRPAGNTLSGSRASDMFLWHCSHHLVVSNGIWQRTSGDQEVYEENDIGPGHVRLTP